jgi:cell division septum initiation protein DivIVA
MPGDRSGPSERGVRAGASGGRTADRVAGIITAAEATAEQLHREAEERVRARIAEGERAARYRVEAAEAEAAELMEQAGEAAARTREDARHSSRELLDDARAAADAVRNEGVELADNLRAMGDSLRANSERLLRDVQALHSQMLGRIEIVEATRRTQQDDPLRARPERGRRDDGDEVPDVPEFIPRR